MLEVGRRQNMTGMETQWARGKCIANALVCQPCWAFLSLVVTEWHGFSTELCYCFAAADRLVTVTAGASHAAGHLGLEGYCEVPQMW